MTKAKVVAGCWLCLLAGCTSEAADPAAMSGGSGGRGAGGRGATDAATPMDAGDPAAGRGGSAGLQGPSAGAAGRDAVGGTGGNTTPKDAGSELDDDAGIVDPPLEPTIELPRLGTPREPGNPGAAEVTLEIRTDQPMHAISPLIYGTNSVTDLPNGSQTLLRAGGNRYTAYNWENNASNAGSDYFYQNDGFLSGDDAPAFAVLETIRSAVQHEAASIITLPIVDYVSADKNADGDVRDSGDDYLTTRFKQNKADKSSPRASTPDLGDAYVYQDEFVGYLRAHAPAERRVLFSLDNEPDLWSSTHPEVHPGAVSYAELWERTERFAGMVKHVWPNAPVLGFVSYGWNGYVNLQNASDADGRDFINWFLEQAKAAETSAGRRVIDYLDLHWYPEALGGDDVRVTKNDTSAEVAAAREQAPRSLWDQTYRENSWIANDYLQGAIYLIPRVRAQIDAHYAGTKLAISEWNYGASNHISGAIATADVLGIFGRERVDLAAHWPLSDDESFAVAAFRAYRNYDGAGGQFGDVSLAAASSDVTNVSVHASLASNAPDHVVVIAINKAVTDKVVALTLAHPTLFTRLDAYRLSAAAPALEAQTALASNAQNAWLVTLAAQSVNVFVAKR